MAVAAMARGPKPAEITLTPDDRAPLDGLVRHRTVGQKVAQRILIVADGNMALHPGTRHRPGPGKDGG